MQRRERVGDQRRSVHVVDGDAIAVVRVRVERRVVTRRHGDLGQLLDRGAELVHVAPGGHGVLGDQRVPERRVELHRAPAPEREVGAPVAAFQVGTRRRAVREHDDFGVAFRDRSGGVLDHELPGGAADAGAVDPRRPETQVLGDLDRCEQPGAAGGKPIDVALLEAGVGERAARGLVVELERRLVVDAAAIRQRGPDDRDAPAHSARYLERQSMRVPDSNSFWPSAMES